MPRARQNSQSVFVGYKDKERANQIGSSGWTVNHHPSLLRDTCWDYIPTSIQGATTRLGSPESGRWRLAAGPAERLLRVCSLGGRGAPEEARVQWTEAPESEADRAAPHCEQAHSAPCPSEVRAPLENVLICTIFHSSSGKESTCRCRRCGRHGFEP